MQSAEDAQNNRKQVNVRYLTNGLRETFDLKGTPIRFLMRGGKNPYAKD